MTGPADLSARPGRIGLIADSHDNHAAMKACISRLRLSHAARRLIHLGDLFDSVKHSHLCEMAKTVTRYQISAVKGNNDFHIQNMLTGGAFINIPDPDKKHILSFLEHLPMKIVDQNVCFTHSLPFDSIRSLYEPVDNGATIRARQVFEQTPYHLICCGHSHAPILFRWRSGVITREMIPLAEKVFLNPCERYIIVVGASDNGECGVVDFHQKTYERICTHSQFAKKYSRADSNRINR
ncbi:MAG: metallophosphoesterase family protein [Desulfobacteraceae bacterium]|nr:metallophosphoesterase family protein [Desulfobacteraceae bacterium]